MQARNAEITRETGKLIEELKRLGWYHSIELPDGRVIEGLQSLDRQRWRLAQFPIPSDLRGKRVLDIGAWDGWFTFEMERRGASVVAVDFAPQKRFHEARKLLNSQAEYVAGDICQLTPAQLGYFDIVLFLGVLYHLKHPMLALERVCEFSKDLVCVESYVTDMGEDPNGIPLMEFYEGTELRGQFDNWVGPNTPCLLAFCRTAGFASVELGAVVDNRAHVACRRKFPEPAAVSAPKPYIVHVENSVTLDHQYSPAHDDYLGIWFKTEEQGLTPDNVFPQAGPYGSRPVVVHSTAENCWHLVCKLPLGLAPGWHEVKLRTAASEWSNALRIGVDLSEEERQRSVTSAGSNGLSIAVATDGRTWERNVVRLGEEAWISLWVEGLPYAASMEEVRVRLNGTDLPAGFLSVPDEDDRRQINARLPRGLQESDAQITVVFRETESPSVAVRLLQ